METRATHGRVAVAVVAAVIAGSTALAAATSAASQPAPASAAPTTGHGPAGARAPYGARLVSCKRAPRVAGRTAVLGATMKPLHGGTHLALRIALYQRPLGPGRWTLRSDVPGLGAWVTPSDPTIGSRAADVFKYRQAVARLVVPFAYRFRVDFRWSDGDGKVVHQARATTATCREPDLRPDLVVANVGVVGMHAVDRVRYVVTIRNDGRSGARGVLVASSFPGRPTFAPETHPAGRIGPGGSATVSFVGPACTTTPAPPAFTVDPANAIEESREDDNTLAADCQASVATLAGR